MERLGIEPIVNMLTASGKGLRAKLVPFFHQQQQASQVWHCDVCDTRRSCADITTQYFTCQSLVVHTTALILWIDLRSSSQRLLASNSSSLLTTSSVFCKTLNLRVKSFLAQHRTPFGSTKQYVGAQSTAQGDIVDHANNLFLLDLQTQEH